MFTTIRLPSMKQMIHRDRFNDNTSPHMPSTALSQPDQQRDRQSPVNEDSLSKKSFPAMLQEFTEDEFFELLVKD